MLSKWPVYDPLSVRAHSSLLFSYTDEEIALHDYLMDCVNGFRDTITAFCESPDQLETFINLVSDYMLHICT